MSRIYLHNEKNPPEVIVMPENVYQSSIGKYFLGQTKSIFFDPNSYAWGGLINPNGSGVNMFLNAYTISNFSSEPITAQGWLSANLPGRAITSQLVAAGNQAICPPSYPKVLIQSVSNTDRTPQGGTYTFVRRVEPSQTLTKHDFQGMYIIPPGSSFVLFFLPSNISEIEVKIAFGYWEEPNNTKNMP